MPQKLENRSKCGISKPLPVLKHTQCGIPSHPYKLTCQYQHLNWLYDLAEKHTKRPVNDRLFEALDFVLSRAESAGLLYPNLRSQMFVWGEENAGVMRCLLIDVLDAMVEMMKQAAPKGSEQSCVYAAEVLFGTALDLAAAPGLHYRTFKERREALRNTIDLTVAGLAST